MNIVRRWWAWLRDLRVVCQRCKKKVRRSRMAGQASWFCRSCVKPIEIICSKCGETYEIGAYSGVHAQVWENRRNGFPDRHLLPAYLRECPKCDAIPF